MSHIKFFFVLSVLGWKKWRRKKILENFGHIKSRTKMENNKLRDENVV